MMSHGNWTAPWWRTRPAAFTACNREIFIDPELFELEMKYIFEGNWIYLAHESQMAKNNDYLTTWMGRQPVIVVPDPDRRAERVHQRVRSSRRDGLPPQEGQQVDLDVPVPRLDLSATTASC